MKLRSFEILFDKEDYPILKNYAFDIADSGSGIYVLARVRMNNERKSVQISRLLMGMPPGYVDHINRNSFDNRKSNLRICTESQNSGNRPGKRKFKGVSPMRSGRFQARIRHAGVNRHLGTYDTEMLAAEAYDLELFRLMGEFGIYNFPEKIKALQAKEGEE